jgi:hypothetical protein
MEGILGRRTTEAERVRGTPCCWLGRQNHQQKIMAAVQWGNTTINKKSVSAVGGTSGKVRNCGRTCRECVLSLFGSGLCVIILDSSNNSYAMQFSYTNCKELLTQNTIGFFHTGINTKKIKSVKK